MKSYAMQSQEPLTVDNYVRWLLDGISDDFMKVVKHILHAEGYEQKCEECRHGLKTDDCLSVQETVLLVLSNLLDFTNDQKVERMGVRDTMDESELKQSLVDFYRIRDALKLLMNYKQI